MDRFLLDPSSKTSTTTALIPLGGLDDVAGQSFGQSIGQSLGHNQGLNLQPPGSTTPRYIKVLMEMPLDPYNGTYNGTDAMNGSLYDGMPPNGTMMFMMPTFTQMSLVKTVVLSLMFVISLIGNTATLIQMYRMRRRKSTIYTLILHLATADLVVTFFCFVTEAVWSSTIQWYAGNVACKLVKFLQVFGLYLSTYIIVIISIDRCFAILDPMSRNKAPRRVRTMIAGAWLLSALFSLPQVGGALFTM
jgi:gonadotropin-releasing hormone receptor